MATLTYTERFALSQNATFKGQVQVAMTKQAGVVLSTMADNTKPSSVFQKKKDLAISITKNPESNLIAFANSVADFGTFASTTVATDVEVLAGVVLVFPYLAGLDITEQ